MLEIVGILFFIIVALILIKITLNAIGDIVEYERKKKGK
ncbi:hypothetical protein HWC66_gp47 [Gordonia phage Chikenjars]|uniref:Uncharacterized protein n=1 Tax=Gordonia phage Chikenjars TaxID=2601686 RepID=A0A5J6D941_9CAUD|nr:hypothetical protein HWC66_gp47 [Gordonia phage Chikenjars]QEQ94350.1 hypothetical protein SEA_CHIKENJARS_47 [Gordonia phage Chikenjars]QXO14071.1 membrane protein [Gordonia phage AlainaMarie]QYC53971.1 hypothetical protein SEA_NITHYA_47 [Gordonia phage Nithya]WNN94369.1 hypothetical protein SEA_ENDAVE_48 [Gordonia phage EndAve]